MSLTWDQVWRRRLARHSLAEPAPPEGMIGVVGAVCGIQAQVMAGAELAIGLRVAGVTRLDVRDELWERRRLVKTYGLRGTIHLFPAAELSMWLAALRAVGSSNRSNVLRDTGTEPVQFDAVVAAIGEALDGGPLTREELGDEVARRVGPWAMDEVVPAFATLWPRWTMAIGEAAIQGLLCFGSNRGNRVTFVAPDRWLGPLEAADPVVALDEVCLRYLRAYGPATPTELAQWLNLAPSTGRAVVGRLRAAGRVEEVEVEGRRAWLPPGEADWAEAEESVESVLVPGEASVRLLPPFDVYSIGCHPRDRLIPLDLLERLGHDRVGATWARRALGGGTVANIPVLLVDGVVAGVWQRRRAGTSLEVRVEPFVELSARMTDRLQAQAARVGEILASKVTFSLGPVEVRPHL